MKAVKVQYTVREDYVEQNKANIRKVMERLRLEPIIGMMYSSFTLADGNTFVHINIAKDEATMAMLSEVAEFGTFRKELKESGTLAPPTSEDLNLVGANF